MWCSKFKEFLSIRFVTSLIWILFIGCLFSCKDSGYPAGDFHFVVISDIHVSDDSAKIERLNSLINKINSGILPGVEFLVATGDIVSCVYGSYYSDRPDTSDNRLIKAVSTFRNLQVPYLLVMGNHDYKIGRDRDSDTYFPEQEIVHMESIWRQYTGFPPYYSRSFRGWNFIVLNSMRGRYLNRHFDKKQLDWLEQELSKKQPVVIFMHHPLKTDNFRIWAKPGDLITPDSEPRFFTILNKNRNTIYGIFVGHGHSWVRDTLFNKVPVYETSSFGDSRNEICFIAGVSMYPFGLIVKKYSDSAVQNIM